ncbi:MAG TPA: hypothetical protein VJ873_07075 [bacterium]|nr:hypothetical protein [bacterium]
MPRFNLGVLLNAALLGAALLGVGARPARAEPYFSAWKGVNCNACHVNETGGFARNDFGKSFGEGLQTFDWEGIGDVLSGVRKATTHRLALSGDLYFNYVRQPNAVPQDTLSAGRQELDLVCYLNKALTGVYTLSSGAKEFYGLVSGLPANGYLKFGTFQLAYGLMLADDQSYIRGPLDFSFNRVDTGIETGFYPDPFFTKVAVYEGDSSDEGKIFSTWDGADLSFLTVGGSFYNQDSASHGGMQRYGVFGWTKVWRLVFLGEYDRGYTQDPITLSWDRTIAIHGSMEADLGNSVYLRFTREFLNPSYAAGDEKTRNVVGINFFPVQYLQVLAQYELVQPVAGPSQGTFSVDAHEFF